MRLLPSSSGAVLALAALLTGSCHVSIQAISTDPSPVQLDFPAGIAIDPDARFLYVSNGNADLSYGGGTLMAIDLLRFECGLDARIAAEQTAAGKTPAAADPSCAPVAALSAGDIAVTRNINNLPTNGCIRDALDPQIIDCVEGPFILGNATARIGNFAGTIRVERTGDPASLAASQTRRVYVAVRGDPSVTYLDVDLGHLLPTPDAGGHIDRPGLLGCFDDPAALLARGGYDASTNTTTVPPRCDDSHLVQTYTCPDKIGCFEGDNNIPSEPFDLLLEHGDHADGSRYSHLLVSHLAAGQVTLIDLTGAPVVADVSPPFFTANMLNQNGVFGMARRGDGDDALYYLTSNLSAAISTFRIMQNEVGGAVIPGAVFSISGSFPVGNAELDILFAPDYQRAFMTVSAPPSIAVVDTRLDQPQGHGLPSNKIVDTVQVCLTPSHLAQRQEELAGPPGAAPSLKTSLYVTCFTSNQMMVVDPDRASVDETILLGVGPTEVAFNFTGPETPVAARLPTPRRRRAYVTQYTESTIGVIDLEPGSPTQNRLIARIGLPLSQNERNDRNNDQ